MIDMGLAAIERGVDDAAQYSTAAGTVMGTVAYMSPEQAADTTEADHRSDIYSLGATLYFLITGQPPYHESTPMKTMLAHRDAPIPSLCETRSDVPRELDQIYQRMMAKDPDDRFQSADDLVIALEALVSEASAANPFETRVTHSARPRRKDTDTVESNPRPILSKRFGNPSFRLRGVLLGMAVVLASGAAATFHIVTDAGELIVVSNEPGIEVVIKHDRRVVKDFQVEQSKTATAIRSGQYIIELRGMDADRFVLSRETVTISRGASEVVTITRRQTGENHQRQDSLSATLPLDCRFNDQGESERHWTWNDDFTFSQGGAKASKGAASYLRCRHHFTGDVSFDLELSLGQAQFANTGAAWIVVWNQRIPIASTWERLDTWIHIHREANEIVFVQNDEERRIPIESSEVPKTTSISIFWRSRGSHFRSVQIQGGDIAALASGSEHSFGFTDRDHTDKHWSWNDGFAFAGDGGMTPRGAASFLRSRGRYSSDTTIDMDFSLGEASFRNTGQAWMTVWGKRLTIANDMQPIDLKIHIHVDNDQIVFRRNAEEQRIPIDPNQFAPPTSIDIRWRSRTAHFRRIDISPPPTNPAL